MPMSGPVFARMENRPILKGVMRGGFADPHNIPNDFLVELRRSGRRTGYSSVARAIMRSLNGFVDARRRYADVVAPVTVAYSEQDWSRPAERQHVAGLLGDINWVTIPNAGHFSALESPTEMASILRQRT
jgi:pimeloyl-ACP methyl ester carboxylesterase